MRELTVRVPGHEYDVHIGDGTYGLFTSRYLSMLEGADRVGIIADRTAAELHMPKLLAALKEARIEPEILTVPAGEACKKADVYLECQSFLLQNSFSRKSLLIAFGGGAAGDLAGFVAATFMRGIPFIQCPTTILAHDSAVGGKTAINMPEGKNMVGSFHQPAAVLFENGVFETLPKREIRSGMAELLKHACISDLVWTEELLASEEFISPSPEWLAAELLKGIAVKAEIVSEDEFEYGSRKFLNFGHTFGHAVEAVCGFGGLSHGECVMIGMAYSLIMSETAGGVTRDWTDRFIQAARRNGYTFDPIQEHPFSDFLAYMRKDKKASFGKLNFILLEKVGQPYVQEVSDSVCEKAFEELKKRTGGNGYECQRSEGRDDC